MHLALCTLQPKCTVRFPFDLLLSADITSTYSENFKVETSFLTLPFLFLTSGAEVTDCGKYLIVSPVKDCRDNLLFFADLTKNPEINGKLPLTQIVHKFEADYEVCSVLLSQ